ncbi:hypothetical protein PVAP13_2NG190906 [Panicum virgatum]|uniref:Uncharacterized protein n=1 Tax=Panicum virgatum TaxID=38727 RepID=A0A8T0VC34_PANVG|nr:hypothetical protein PVAP13_2NG190906 [Panicum virgatum]
MTSTSIWSPWRHMMTMRRWGAKRYILAALLGTLVAVAVVASISISLAPAHISFSVANAEITNTTVANTNGNLINLYYNFTLVANNTASKRTAVSFASLSAEIWESETAWVPAEEVNTTAEPELYQGLLPAGSAARVKIWAESGQYNEVEAGNGNNGTKKQHGGTAPATDDNKHTGAPAGNDTVKWPNCRVVVEAKVWFSLGLLRTRPFTVIASCYPVNFKYAISAPVTCTS